MLGVQPMMGRFLTTEDDQEGAPDTVLLSYGLWQGAFGPNQQVPDGGLVFYAPRELVIRSSGEVEPLLPGDTVTYLTAVGAALLMTVSGSFLPALRAVRVDPMRALRTE